MIRWIVVDDPMVLVAENVLKFPVNFGRLDDPFPSQVLPAAKFMDQRPRLRSARNSG